MDLLIAFLVFLAALIVSLVKGISVTYVLVLGLALFLGVGMRRGFSLPELGKMSWVGVRKSLIVIEVMCVIGFITAIWRVSGTITIFVYYGMKVITPPLFLEIAFVLSCILSYALGTSFGVAGTVGVIFMTLARSGGVDPVLTAGVLMSGVYFGDRCSPVSSSANMVAGVTETKIMDNVRIMMKTGMVPLIICLLIYGVISFLHPISSVDEALMAEFESSFNLSLWAFVPAVLMLVLPLLKVDLMLCMFLSIGSGALVAWLVQGVPLLEILKTSIFGYQAADEGLGSILNGGGLLSMLEVVIILIISCMYSGIFDGTDMLRSVQERITAACARFGRFAVMIILSFLSAMLFCNQTIATLMCNDLLQKPYLEAGGSKEELAIDMENSVILIACSIPWAIGCAVPLSFFGVGPKAMLYAFFMYLVPIYYLFAKKRWYKDK